MSKPIEPTRIRAAARPEMFDLAAEARKAVAAILTDQRKRLANATDPAEAARLQRALDWYRSEICAREG